MNRPKKPRKPRKPRKVKPKSPNSGKLAKPSKSGYSKRIKKIKDAYASHCFNGRRNYNDPAYKQFRKDVRRRDNRTCQFPGCGATKHIQVHHILPWSDYPHLRCDTTNGVCLCRKCHQRIWKNEYLYVKMFREIVDRNIKKMKDQDNDPQNSC